MSYAQGFVIVFNYLIGRGSLKFANGKYSFDVSSLVYIDEITSEILKVFEEGDDQDVQKLIDAYGSFEKFEAIK
jgi:hypothetical protein